MEWVVAALALALLVGKGLMPLWRRDDTSAPHYEAELDEIFAAVDAQSSTDLVRLLRIRTQELIGRQVPVRDIRAAPAPRVARIAFSNGDIVLATAQRPGDLIGMAKAMIVTSVTLTKLSVTDDGPMLHFGWNYGHSLVVHAVGLDQAD
ncbi:MAG: hypothetical protein WBG36_03150 [Ornithinimicrobium sp.]